MQWRIQDLPLGEVRAIGMGGADLRCGHFSAKTYAKTKELDPVGEGGDAPVVRPQDLLMACLLK